MSFDDAASALHGAFEADAGPSSEPAPSEPTASVEQAAEVVGSQGSEAPVTDAAPEVTPEDTFDGGKFNPDTLPPELQPGWKQLQAEFTRKTQQLAERAKQFETIGDPETLAAAVELRQRLQDPSTWPALHAELSSALQEMGLSPAQASAEAARQMEVGQPGVPTHEEDPFAALAADPELAPLKSVFDSMKSELEGLRSEINQEKEQARAEQMHMALVGELNRQEAIIRETNPTYQDEDVNMAYELSAFHDGNLLEAQARLEQYFQGRLARYLQSKSAVAATPGAAPLSGGGTVAAEPGSEPTSLEDATKQAIEHLRQQDLLELA